MAIATLTGESGILTQAQNAKNDMTKAEAKERIQLEVLGRKGTETVVDNPIYNSTYSVDTETNLLP